MRTKPRLDCIGSWQNGQALLCNFPPSADAVLLATPYVVKVGHGFWSQAGEKLAPVSLTLHSKLPEIAADGVEWRSGQALFRLSTGAKVETVELQRVLRLDAAHARGLPLQLEPLAAAPGAQTCEKKRRCWIARSGDATLSGELRLHITPGLCSDEGPVPGAQEGLLASALQHVPFQLRRGYCGRTTCAAGGLLVLEFSRKPDEPALRRWLEQLPAGRAPDPGDQPAPHPMPAGDVKLETETRWRRGLRIKRARQDLRLVLPDWLTAGNGRASLAPDEIAFHSADFQPTLEMQRPRLLLQPGDPAPVKRGRCAARGAHAKPVAPGPFGCRGSAGTGPHVPGKRLVRVLPR